MRCESYSVTFNDEDWNPLKETIQRDIKVNYGRSANESYSIKYFIEKVQFIEKIKG